jgi:TetR/AcrR family transcriptional regulator, regulator of cefoperazone and chloramphenicol sensitivity
LYKVAIMADLDSDRTRERILEAAGQLFADHGFEATTVRDICQTAGANIAAVNYYFGDKERLYVEAVVRAHKWRLDQVQLPAWDEETAAREKLADFIHTFFQRVLGGPDDTWRTRLVMREIMNPTKACKEIAHSNIRPQFEILQAILRDLLPASTSAEELHLTAFSIVGQCLFYHVAAPVIRNLIDDDEYAAYGVDKLAAHVTKLMLAAIDAKNMKTRPQGASR